MTCRNAIKMAVFAALTLMTVYSAGAAPAQPPVNLVPNPSFEQPAKGHPELALGWSPYQCGYTRSREKSYAPDISGPWSCQITGSGKANEKGVGGANIGISDGLPDHGTFAATNSIYVASYTQGGIYGAYVTSNYTDGTATTHSFRLSDAQIKANIGHWKTYRFTFTSDPKKKLKAITYWCLVWSRGKQKFIGTVYFDEVELRQVETGGQAEAPLPFVLASRALTPPRLDGVEDDKCWRNSVQLSPFILSGGTEPATEQTAAHLAYDDSHLYIFFKCFESVLNPALQKRDEFKATQTQHDSDVFKDDEVEIFLQPAPSSDTYYQLAVNSLGAIYDARCRTNGVFDKSWDSGAEVKTTVGNRAWTVEMAIPLARLGAHAPAAGEQWRMNLCRQEKPSAENSCWSPTGGPFHTPTRFGVLAFGPPVLGVGVADLGALRKGANELQLAVTNSAAKPQALTVTASAAPPAGAAEIGRVSVLIPPGKSQTVSVPYTATAEGALRYEVTQNGRLLLVSPGYPVATDNPFIAKVNVQGKNLTCVVPSFSVAQGETLAVPLVLLAGIEKEQFHSAQVVLEVPEFLHLISPLSGPRRCPTPLRVKQALVRRAGHPCRRLTLDFGAASVTFPSARQQRDYVENPLVFKADYVADAPGAAASSVIAYEVGFNGKSKASGTVPLTLLPPLRRQSPKQVVVCNWPCGSIYYGRFFSRLSTAEQGAITQSWLHTGFNIYSYSASLGDYYRTHGLRAAFGLPGNLENICGNLPDLPAYLKAHPQFRDANLSGKLLKNVISPAELLDPNCPVRQMIRDFVGQAARQHPVLSWDYEVPVAYPDSIGFGAFNLAAFRQAVHIADTVKLTPDVVVRDYRQQWIDFRCHQNAQLVKLLQEGIKAANPRCQFFVYSGYQSPHTQETYGINWKYVGPYVDQAWCGYGRPVQATQDTLAALHGTPLVGGELAWLGGGHAYDQDLAEVNLMHRLTDCGGGFMVYYDWSMDGRFFTAVSRTAAVAADFEDFFLKGKRDDALATVQTGDKGNVVVYSLGSQRLVFLFNPTAAAQPYQVRFPGLPAGAVGLDYWTKQPVKVSPLTTSVSPYGVEVVHIVPSAGGGTPAPPAPLSHKQTITDRRPLLAWGEAGGADCRYVVEVSPDRTFPATSTITAKGLSADTHVVTQPLDDSQPYYWRVRAVDALSGKTSVWSPTAEFTLGLLSVAVQPTVFSPNGDGIYDTVSLQAELRQPGPWEVTVTNATGQTIKTFSGQTADITATWNGKDAAGKTAPAGYYELRLAVKGRPITAQKVELNPRFGVPNPQLERWCSWRPQVLSGGAADQDYHTAPAGLSYSFRLVGNTPDAVAYWANYRTGTEIPVTPGKSYTYSGLVKTDLGKDAEASISLHFFTKEDRWAAIPGQENEWDGVTAKLQGRHDWTKLTVSCQAPQNAAKAVLFFSLKGQGKAWLGSVEFGETNK